MLRKAKENALDKELIQENKIRILRKRHDCYFKNINQDRYDKEKARKLVFFERSDKMNVLLRKKSDDKVNPIL